VEAFHAGAAQLVSPIGHCSSQKPVPPAPWLVHTWPAPHAIPQPPQLFASATVLTQFEPQSVRPLWQLTWHELPAQIWPGAQATPQPPQLARSLVRSTQFRFPAESVQAVCPGVQVMVHFPRTQCVPVEQTVVQKPQAESSLVRSRQLPEQLVRFNAQSTAQCPG
jgi:hypothetical protein